MEMKKIGSSLKKSDKDKSLEKEFNDARFQAQKAFKAANKKELDSFFSIKQSKPAQLKALLDGLMELAGRKSGPESWHEYFAQNNYEPPCLNNEGF